MILALWLAVSAPAADSTREMAAYLEELNGRVDVMALPLVVNAQRAEAVARQFARTPPGPERLRLRTMFAVELINAGRPEDALLALRALEDDARALDPLAWQETRTGAWMLQALAHLRIGEVQNCCAINDRQACLLPIRGGGVHRRPEGSTGAVGVLERVLAVEPENLRARWLLNIAHMTLGSYPKGVGEKHLLRPELFASEYPLPKFPNVAMDIGLDDLALAGGGLVDDFDQDGRLDVMVSSMGLRDQVRLLRSKGDGTFEDRTAAAGLTGEVGGLNLLHADYDNDGFLDVLVLRGGWMGAPGRFPVSLLRGSAGGRFEDVTRAAGLLGHLAPTQTAAWLDYDGDGKLDLYIGNESIVGAAHPCELYRNNGDGTFTEVARQVGLDVVAYVKGVVAGDYDNDGRPDLYVSVWGGDNRLFHNEGPEAGGKWRFKDVALEAGVKEPHGSFSTFFFDYDNDGWLDLFVAGYGTPRGGFPLVEHQAADYLGLEHDGERGRLYRNRGDGTFEDVTKAALLYRFVPAMGINFGDLDNDGWLDFYTGTGTPDLGMLVPNRMFRNDGGRRFQDVTTAGDFGHLQKGHGIAFADIDNDGDQDVFEEMGGAYLADTARSALYLNPGNANGWLSLELEGVRSNRRGLGARIKVVLDTPSGRRTVHRLAGTGGSFGGSPLRQEIGLGDARRIEAVEIHWPASGERTVLKGLALGRRYRVREGAAEAVPVENPSFAFKSR